MTDPAIEAVGLVKHYPGRAAVQGVDLLVPPGQIHGLLGANGAGKTTVLRLLLGLASIDSGHVRLFGHDAAGAAGSLPDRMSGFVDVPGFSPPLSGRRNLHLLARLDDGTEPSTRERTVDEAIEQVGLAAHADRRFRSYSAGMRQRLGIAAALLRAPRLLLLDEPTSSLDPVSAHAIRRHLRELAAAGTAIVLTSHDMREVEEICDAVTVLHEGRVLFAGTLTELRAASPGATYRLRTSDDERATILADGRARVSGDGLEVSAEEGTLDPYILALGANGIAVRHLERLEPSLAALVEALVTTLPARALAETSLPRPRSSQRRSGSFTFAHVASVAGVECRKLASLTKTRAALATCLAAPFVFALAMKVQTSTPDDTLFGRSVGSSGFAVPLVILGFAAQWVFPVLTGLVAGDLFSSEDRDRTWSTLLTRSRSRVEVFLGKTVAAVAFSVLVVAVLGAASIAAGAMVIGTQPLIGLSGNELVGADALRAVGLAWVSVLPPAIGFTGLALLVSIATRSGVAGVGLPVLVGFVMELLSLVAGADGFRPFTLTAPFVGWHGLFTSPRFLGPIAQGTTVSVTYAAASLLVAGVVFTRRDVRS